MGHCEGHSGAVESNTKNVLNKRNSIVWGHSKETRAEIDSTIIPG